MDLLNLPTVHPCICDFHRALGKTLNSGIHTGNQGGRKDDGFAYILFGKADYDFKDYTIQATAGDVVYLAQGARYTVRVTGESLGVLLVNFSFLKKNDESFLSAAVHAPGGKNTENLFHRILTVWQMKSPTVKEDCMSVLYAIYSDFLSNNLNYVSSDKKELMQTATEYIAGHLSNPDLTVAEVAKAVMLSETHFRRLFKKKYCMSPIQYINMLRITRAKTALKHSADTVTQIAERSGFSDPNYFSIIFKKETGCTPSQYRKIRKAESNAPGG